MHEEGDYHRQEEEVARVRYKYAMRDLKIEAGATCEVPLVEIPDPTVAEGSYPCRCGYGRIGAWPWTVQPTESGFCGNRSSVLCRYECTVLLDARCEWVAASEERNPSVRHAW